MSITFSEVMMNRLLSETTLNILPRRCNCGAELVFSDSLRELHCSNPDCKSYMLNRVLELSNSLKLELS